MASPQKYTEMNEFSPVDKEAVLVQVERIISSPHFKSSRRCTDMLRYVVQQTIEGHSDILKERALGIEIFGREPSFDTSGDSIVRVAAAEVRKRLALYYQGTGHEHEIRVEFPSGSYVARLRYSPEATPAIGTQPEAADPALTGKTGNAEKVNAASTRWMKLIFAAAITVLIAIVAFAELRPRSNAGLNRFWGPVLDPSAPVLICVGTVEPSHLDLNGFTAQMANHINAADDSLIPIPQFRDWPAVSWTDAAEISRITATLTRHDKTFLLRPSDAVTLSDLRKGPVIMLGVLENSWSLRLVSKLRFHPRMDAATQKMWIEDAQHPERKDWSYPWGVAYSDTLDDYALVTRSRDLLSGQVSIEIGGLGLHASQAAGEFVTNPVYMNNLSRSLADPNKNVQIVLRINVIKGEAGPPQVVAEYYW